MAGNMQKMMKQMQQMQAKMAKLQEELANTPVEATAGGGVVKVTVNGANQVLGIEIKPRYWIQTIPKWSKIWSWQRSMKRCAMLRK